jgi:hypothetical protein
MGYHARTLAGIVATAMWAGAASASAAAANDPITLTVIVYNHPGVPAAALAQAEQVAARVFRQIGIDVTWHHDPAQFDRDLPTDPAAQAAVFGSLIVVHLLSASMAAGLEVPQGVMGQATPGSHLASVLYGRVSALADAEQADLATVLGHVIAHEIGHLLLAPNAHSASGIMRARLDLQLAGRGVLWFSPTQAAVIRAKLSATRVPVLR